MDVQARKDRLRRLVLGRRARLDPAERAARGDALLTRLMALPEVAAAPTVCAFVSFSSEVPTEPLLRALLGSGKRLLIPYVAEDGDLRASPISSLDELAPGYRGILEPRARMPVAAGAADVIVCPGVAFDARGGRLGYGGGFFDAFLRAAPNRPRIGICFELQVVEEVPMAGHDERVDAVVTDERVILCPRPPAG